MLDARLRCIADLVRPGNRLIDIGSDHAHLPVSLVREGRCPSAIATDVREGPLRNARQNVEAADLAARIELRLGDGLQPIRPGEGDTLVVAGMGGGNIAQMLSRCPWVKDARYQLLLQPMSRPELLRKYLYQNGFAIESEHIVPDGVHDYTVLSVRYAEAPSVEDRIQWVLGKVPLPEGERYLRRQRRRFEKQLQGLRCLLEAGAGTVGAAGVLADEPVTPEQLERLLRAIDDRLAAFPPGPNVHMGFFEKALILLVFSQSINSTLHPKSVFGASQN